MGVIIRPGEPADDAAILTLIADCEPDGAPLSAEEYRAGADRSLRAGTGEQWVAVHDDAIAGIAFFSHAWWTHSPTVYSIEIRVATERRNQGLGMALYERVLDRVSEHGATALLVWVRQDDGESRHFAEQRGFYPSGQIIEECRLELSDATLDGVDAIHERLHAQGIRIIALSEIDLADETLLRGVQRVSAGGEEPRMTLHDWRAATLDAPGCSPETFWVALHRDVPVGLTFLKRLGPDAAENDFTGVLPEYRGRGIARVLKARAIVWGRANGLRSFHTSSLIENERMIAINYGLGYVAGARRMEVSRRIPLGILV